MPHIELTNDEIRNTKAYKEYYAFATREAAPKPKARARRKQNGSHTFITPLTVVVTPKLTAAAKGKQPAKSTKAKSPSAPSEAFVDDHCKGSPWLIELIDVDIIGNYSFRFLTFECWEQESHPSPLVAQVARSITEIGGSDQLQFGLIARSVPEELTRSVPKEPSRSVPKKPSRSVPEEPSRSVPEETTRSVPKEPSRLVLKEPTRSYPKEPSRSVLEERI
nr:hypothetical protein [Tanacetum cinerariifolium]